MGSSKQSSFGPRLPRSFFGRSAIEVAPDLLGTVLVRGAVALRITEVEAYLGPHDSACHTRSGRTARNATMWGPPGRAYVYLCYGMHSMLNVVTGDHSGEAVLVRAAEPVEGLVTIRRRRGGREGPVLTDGPAKVAQALALRVGDDGEDLARVGGIELRRGVRPEGIVVGPRVGIDYAVPADRDALLRFAVAGSRWVGHRGSLRPVGAAR